MIDRRPRAAVCAAAGALLLAACASTVHNAVPGGPTFGDGDLRFVAPTGWEVRASTEVSFGPSRRIVYLANQPLHDDCVNDPAGVVCRAPIDGGLRPGGMLVTWVTSACVAKGCDLPSGRLIGIGNRHGVLVPLSEGCGEIGFTEASAYHVTVTPQRLDTLIACARDPSDATRAALLGFLDAIHWRIP